jgi:hypothetical protein
MQETKTINFLDQLLIEVEDRELQVIVKVVEKAFYTRIR